MTWTVCRALRVTYRATAGEYFRIRPAERYEQAPFVIRQTAAEPIVGPREGATYLRNSLLALYPPTDGTDVRYLVGLLNSRLLRWAYRRLTPESGQKAFPQVKVRALRALPIRRIDPNDAADRAAHDRIVELVGRLLDLHRRADDHDERRRVDRAIDHAVYELYGLTDEEIQRTEDEAD